MTAQKQVGASKGEAMTLDLTELGSVGILQVLETVTKQGTINIGHLLRKTGLNHTGVDHHVKKLVELGLVEERRYGSIRMIKPTFDSLVVMFKRGMGVKVVRT
jgi:DNA-binding transcriptional ArsR family regulator